MNDEVIKVEDIEVHIDRKLMNFNETNLNEYLQKEGPYCEYIATQLAKLEARYEKIFNKKFVEFKEEGGSDRFVEARCKADDRLAEYQDAIKALKAHHRAWGTNHDNAISYGHNLRKEMEKLDNDIKIGGYSHKDIDSSIAELMGVNQ
jgi:hypothetical protein